MALLKAKVPFKVGIEQLEIIRDHPHILGWIAGKTKLTELHSSWIKHIWDTNEHTAIQAHRGSYKTTSVGAVGIIRWMLFNPDDRIAVVRKTFTDAAEIVTMVGQLMETREIQELFKAAYGFYPKAKVKKYGRLLYNFKTTITPEGSVTAHGLDGSLTGKHYDKILTDDIVTLKDRISLADRERTREMVREIYTNIIDPGKPVMAIGTPWHRDDAWNDVPCAIYKFPISKCNILTPDEIELKRKTTTPFLFAVNYELEFQADESCLFQNPTWCEWDYLAPQVIFHLDAAFDGDHTCALTAMTKSKLQVGRLQGKGWTYPGNVKDWAPEIARIYKTHRGTQIHVETNADKGYTGDLLRTFGLNVIDYAETENKGIKISTHLYQAWDFIDWSQDTEPEYMNQVLDWKMGQEPDDCPDSAASLVRTAFPQNNSDGGSLYEW
jgi:hypothetical protein